MEHLSNEISEQGQPYIVTRGKPPREHQFRPGQSGNPNGRPKGSKELRTLLEQELERKVDATIAGQNVRLTKRKAMVKRLVDKAIQGDLKALLTIVRMEEQGGPLRGSGAAPIDIDAVTAKEEQILYGFLARTPNKGNETGGEHGVPD